MALLRGLATLVVLLLTPYLTAALLFVTDNSMRRMVSFTSTGKCATHQDRKTIMRAVLSAPSHQLRRTNAQELSLLTVACTQHNSVPMNNSRAFIYPGTKWCGPGNQAGNFDDLGFSSREDRCCREHDQCPKFLMPGQCTQNVCNDTPYTRSECKCDNTFRECLKAVGSPTADTIGFIYFNVAKVMCFHESSRCSENEVGRCGLISNGQYQDTQSDINH